MSQMMSHKQIEEFFTNDVRGKEMIMTHIEREAEKLFKESNDIDYLSWLHDKALMWKADKELQNTILSKSELDMLPRTIGFLIIDGIYSRFIQLFEEQRASYAINT